MVHNKEIKQIQDELKSMKEFHPLNCNRISLKPDKYWPQITDDYFNKFINLLDLLKKKMGEKDFDLWIKEQ